MKGIVDSSFVEREFYSPPPKKDASPEVWEQWLKKEANKRKAHKAAHTRSLEQADTPEDYQQLSTVKIGGKWTQRALLVGFAGDADEGTMEAEPGQREQQEHHIALVDMERTRNKRGGNNRAGMSRRRRANAKARKKARAKARRAKEGAK